MAITTTKSKAAAELRDWPLMKNNVAREDLDAILDYVVHVAMLKSGGAEFASTAPLFQRFLKQAQLYNSKLAELGEFSATIFGQSQREAQTNPVAVPVGDE